MPREKEGYRAQLEFLVTLCPGVASVDIKTCTKILGCERHTLLNDKTFPAKKVGGKYIVPLSELARWMCGREKRMSTLEFLLVVIGAATLTSWLFKAVDVLEGR